MKKEKMKRIFEKWNEFVGWVGILAFIVTGILLFDLNIWLLKSATMRITWLEGGLIIIGSIGVCFMVYLVICFMFRVDD